MKLEKTMRNLWIAAVFLPLPVALVLYITNATIDFYLMLAANMAAALAAADGYRRAYNYGKNNLQKKLEYLENEGVVFRAGYRGVGETFTAVEKNGIFIDYHWLKTNGRDQWIKPTEMRRIVDETIEEHEDILEEGMWNELEG